jgi:hypothetical protein
MRIGVVHIMIASAFSIATPVLAQSAPATEAAPAQIKAGARIYSSDGKFVGRVDRLSQAKDGTLTSAAIIYGSKFVYVPISTLTPHEKGYASPLTRAQIVAGK